MCHFQKTITVNADQRYEVTLPWIIGHTSMYNNFNTSMTTLHTVSSHLNKDNILETYHNIYFAMASRGHNWRSKGG